MQASKGRTTLMYGWSSRPNQADWKSQWTFRVSYRTLLGVALITVLAVIPLVGSFDTLQSIGIIEGRVMRDRSNHPFPAIFALRELVALGAYVVLVAVIASRPIPQWFRQLLIACTLLVSLVIVYAIYSLFTYGPAVALSGLRMVYYLPLCFVSIAYFLRTDGPKHKWVIIMPLYIVFYIEFFVIVAQIFLMPPWEGRSLFGPRVLGTFNNPNAIGLTIVALLYAFLFLDSQRSVLRGLTVFLAMVAVLATDSRMAVFLAVLLLAVSMIRLKQASIRIVGLPSAIFLIVGMIFTMMLSGSSWGLTSREFSLQDVSLLTRINILTERLESGSDWESLFGQGLGVGTNALFLFRESVLGQGNSSILFIADSTITSLIAQIGLIGLIITVMTSLIIFSYAGLRGIMLLVLFWGSGLSNNVLELYPVNVLIPIYLGMLYAERFATRVRRHPRLVQQSNLAGLSVIPPQGAERLP